uniref:Importin subunit alpha-1b-like n=1 Tax=Rhizophora mucronata TaxID=61149 RepID=A0A2P2MCM1_RHIMU
MHLLVALSHLLLPTNTSQEFSLSSHKSLHCHETVDSQFSPTPQHHQSFEHRGLHPHCGPNSCQLLLPSKCSQALLNRLLQSLDQGR